MKTEKKPSARRCGRVLSILYLNENLEKSQFTSISNSYIEELEDYMPEFSLLPDKIQQNSITFANELTQAILDKKDELIKTITQNTKNRTWDKFYPLDKALLLVGTYGLEQDVAGLIIKEILISSDILENNNAAPYLSGILKSIAEYDGTKPNVIKKGAKIRIKSPRKDAR